MKSYFVCKSPGNSFVGSYTVERIQALVSSGEVTKEYVVTEATGSSFHKLMKEGGATWFTIAELLENPDQTPDEKLTDCPLCKKQISPHAPSCPNCGHPIRTQTIHNIQLQETRKTNVALRIIIILICLPFIIASLRSCAAGR